MNRRAESTGLRKDILSVCRSQFSLHNPQKTHEPILPTTFHARDKVNHEEILKSPTHDM